MISQHPEDLLDRLSCYHYAILAVARFAVDDSDSYSARDTIDLIYEEMCRVSQQLEQSIKTRSQVTKPEAAPNVKAPTGKSREALGGKSRNKNTGARA